MFGKIKNYVNKTKFLVPRKKGNWKNMVQQTGQSTAKCTHTEIRKNGKISKNIKWFYVIKLGGV